ncbi:phosphatidylinositol N-acetylglucosaminyltransferase subunit C [Harmonia axyridis]|uniref:phosphatidylinositol N-acetylglucosaminyltransferase subunit C n=1 Tax=Harmonia axyridis TaxID=115357 RepID=UPI001E276765|nr:phosphatidylinositol N-acetylglucosaminyltransferase subunit C [Harmonia axyridis]
MDPWEKVLYKHQSYPDNYTDNTFLRDLKKNIDFKEVTYFEAFISANLLLQEICTVIGFVLVYIYLYNEWLPPNLIFNTFNCLTLVGFLLHKFHYINTAFFDMISHDLRTLLIYIVFGHLFSPVLYTLTDTISTDTIYTMTSFMLLIHLIFFDYGVNATIVSNSLSLSAAIFASICLASRLSSAHYAFILITIAIECFVLFPHLRVNTKFSLLITLALALCDLYFLNLVSRFVTVIFLISLLFIIFICPLLFVKYQKYKENIYGPWDEAVVEDADKTLYFR